MVRQFLKPEEILITVNPKEHELYLHPVCAHQILTRKSIQFAFLQFLRSVQANVAAVMCSYSQSILFLLLSNRWADKFPFRSKYVLGSQCITAAF